MIPSTIDVGLAGRLLVAVISIVVLAACGGAGNPEAASATSVPKTYTTDELPGILVSDDNAPEATTVGPGDTGFTALFLAIPGGKTIDQSAFVDALTTRVEHTETGGYTSWAALFETSADAQQAFQSLAGLHEADDGHGLEPLQPDVQLSGDSVMYRGPYKGWDAAGIYLWRESNLLLAAVGVNAYQPEVLRSIVEGMDGRAN